MSSLHGLGVGLRSDCRGLPRGSFLDVGTALCLGDGGQNNLCLCSDSQDCMPPMPLQASFIVHKLQIIKRTTKNWTS